MNKTDKPLSKLTKAGKWKKTKINNIRHEKINITGLSALKVNRVNTKIYM